MKFRRRIRADVAAVLLATLVGFVPLASADGAPTRSGVSLQLRAVIERARQRNEQSNREADAGSASDRIGRASQATTGRSLSTPFVRVDARGRAHVSVLVDGPTAAVVDAIVRLGGEVEVVSAMLGRVQAWLALRHLDALAARSNVLRVEAPRYGRRRVGSVLTEGDAIMRTQRLRTLNVDGRGIRIGVISDGWAGLTTAQGAGELPADVATYGECAIEPEDFPNCVPATECNEGVAMAEIIHDMAPAAELAVAAVFGNSSVGFVEAARLLVEDFGADIVVDDLGFFGEPYFEDGELARGIAALTSRALFISSAGNSADTHHEADFDAYPGSGGTLHDFGTASGGLPNNRMPIFVPPQEYALAILQWDDPFERPSNDYGLLMADASGTSALCDSAFCVGDARQSGQSGQFAFEAVCFYNRTDRGINASLVVSKNAGADDARLELFILGRTEVDGFAVPAGSVFGHSALTDVLTVGAVNVDDALAGPIAEYSSYGVSRIVRPVAESRNKPDVVGIDGVSVSGAAGFPMTFFGTSAAAPHVAALAGLLKQARPGISPADLHAAVRAQAVDLGASGRDDVYGHGRADAGQAYGRVIATRVLPLFVDLIE